MLFVLFAGVRQKSPVIHVTSHPPSVAKIRRVRRHENVEKLGKRKNFCRNAKRSSG